MMKLFGPGLIAVLVMTLGMQMSVLAEEGENISAWAVLGAPSDGTEGRELGIIIDGEMAKKVYLAMPVAEMPEPCTEGFQKRDGDGLFCIVTPDRKEYQCSFGYVLGKQRVTFGPLRC